MTPPARQDGSVVVGVDASFGSAHAVQWAASEASRSGSPLHLIHAIDDQERDGDAVVAAFATMALRAFPELDVHHRCVQGSAVDVLLDAAESAWRVVLGANGTASFAVGALGSVTHRVAVRAPCPVVVVPADSGQSGSGWGPVVAGIGADASAREVADVAADEAVGRGARLLLVHVRAGEVADGATALTEAARRLRARQPSLEIATATPIGERAPTVLDLASRARLLVLGCHHGTRRFDTRLGDLAAAVVPLATCPVVLVGARPPAGP